MNPVLLQSACRKAKRTARLAAALSVAAVVSWRQPRVALVKLWAAFTAFRRFKGDAPFWTTYRRYRACHRCFLFYRPIRTCGTPILPELREYGCYCNMEAKSAIANATCWLRDQGVETDDYGWPRTQ